MAAILRPPCFRRYQGALVNKNDLVAHVSSKSGLSKTDATKAVDAVFEGITSSLKKGVEVRLVGFGTFAISKRAASEGRNPRTGEKIKIKASKQPKFKAGKSLKDAVN
jgi:DNA-binding protein HU-beta